MRKIYNIIPGKLISEDYVTNKIFSLIDSVEFNKWLEVNEDIYSSDFFKENDEFYVLYLDPAGKMKKLYITKSDDIFNFMKERINYNYGEGADIAICTKSIDNAIICNHDGQIFLLSDKYWL